MPGHQRDFSGYDFTRAALPGVQWAGQVLQGACFRNANLRGANMRAVDARGANFDGADLTRADFSEALLQSASLRQAQLYRTNFHQAMLVSAHLQYAMVRGTNFTAANCEWAWVEGVDFRQALLAGTLLLNAHGLAEDMRQVVEARGGVTGVRTMILGRELDERVP